MLNIVVEPQNISVSNGTNTISAKTTSSCFQPIVKSMLVASRSFLSFISHHGNYDENIVKEFDQLWQSTLFVW